MRRRGRRKEERRGLRRERGAMFVTVFGGEGVGCRGTGWGGMKGGRKRPKVSRLFY